MSVIDQICVFQFICFFLPQYCIADSYMYFIIKNSVIYVVFREKVTLAQVFNLRGYQNLSFILFTIVYLTP